MEEEITFRPAEGSDTALILKFIKALAEYEHMSGMVTATEDILHEWIFEKNRAEVLFAIKSGTEIGFALYFYNFSTFLGKAGIYLEDLFVYPEYRGCGCGKKIMQELAKTAVSRGCGRLEWQCLNWNEPSIEFYLSLDAQPMSDWTVYRLAGDSLLSLANGTDI